MELYVFMAMSNSGKGSIHVVPLGNSEEVAAIRRSWGSFDVEACDCFDPKDKEHLLRVVRKGSGSFDVFNRNVHDLLSTFDVLREWPSPSAGLVRVEHFRLSFGSIDLDVTDSESERAGSGDRTAPRGDAPVSGRLTNNVTRVTLTM